MKPYDLSQYMYRVTLPTGAGLMGYSNTETYAAGTVGEAIKNMAAGGGGGGGGSGVVTTSYIYNNNLGAPPDIGEIRFDTAPPNTATTMKVHQTTTDGIDAGLAYSYLAPGQRVYIQDADDAARYLKATVVGTPADMGDWWSFPILVTEATVPSLLMERVTLGWPASAASGSGIPQNVIPKGGAAGGLVASQFFDGGVNVGLGTNTPGKKLSIVGGGLGFDDADTVGRGVNWGDGSVYPVAVTGDAAAGTMGFFTNAGGTAGVERMRITAAGFVGIGTITPEARLHVDDGFIQVQRYSNSGAIKFQAAGGTKAVPTKLLAGAQVSWMGQYGYDGAVYRDMGNIATYAEADVSSTSAPSFTTFNTTPVGAVAALERMRIASTGNVGIGTISPQEMLHIDGGAVRSSRYGQSAGLIMTSAAGTKALPTAIAAESQLAWLGASGYDGAAYRNATNIAMYSQGAITPTSAPGFIQFSTAPSGSIVAAERMRIDSNGSVGIGTAETLPTLNPAVKLYLKGDMALVNPVAASYTFNTNYYSANWKSVNTGFGCALRFDSTTGELAIWNAPASVAAGATLAMTPRMIVKANGFTGFGAIANYSGLLQAGSPDGVIQFGTQGTTKGIRFTTYAGNSGIEGVDNTLVGSYQKITLTGLPVFIASAASGQGLIIDGNCSPVVDNGTQLGWTGGRFSALYVVAAPVVGSDAREKTWVGDVSPAEMRVAERIIDELGFYRWNDMDDDKLHLGVRAQQVLRILIEEGLEDGFDFDVARDVRVDVPTFRYSFITFDSWDAYERDKPGPRDIDPAVKPEREMAPAGNRFGMNYTELSLFIAVAQHARLNAQEARIAHLEGHIHGEPGHH